MNCPFKYLNLQEVLKENNWNHRDSPEKSSWIPAHWPQMIGWATLNNGVLMETYVVHRGRLLKSFVRAWDLSSIVNSAHRPWIRAAAATDLYNGKICFNFHLFAHIPTFLPHVILPSACRAVSQSITLTWLHLFNRKSLCSL